MVIPNKLYTSAAARHRKPPWRSNRLFPCEVQLLKAYGNYVAISCFQLKDSLYSLNFWMPEVFVTSSWATRFPVTSFSWLLHCPDSENSHDSWFLSLAAGFPTTLSTIPPRHASCSFTSELDAASGFEFLLPWRQVFLKLWVSPGLLMQSDLSRMRNLPKKFKTSSLPSVLILPQYFPLLFIPASSSPSLWSS